MKKQKTIEKKILRIISMKTIDLSLLKAIEMPFECFSSSIGFFEIKEKLGKLDITAETKLEILDIISPMYDHTNLSFSSVISNTIENKLDYNFKLVTKYGDIYSFVHGKPLIEYLWANNKFDYVEELVSKSDEIDLGNALFNLKYYHGGSNDLIKYLEEKIKNNTTNEIIKRIDSIKLHAENVITFELKLDEIESLVINDLSLVDFLDSKQSYIESIEIKSKNEFLPDIDILEFDDEEDLIEIPYDIYNYFDSEEEKLEYISIYDAGYIIDNIVSFSIVFKNKKEKTYYINWLSDSEF